MVAAFAALTSALTSPIFNAKILAKRDISENSAIEGWFNQTVDHFGSNTDIWAQQYMANYEYYKPGGPIIILTPGEAELSDVYTVSTHFTELAESTNGILVAVEHRFFGQSNPMPDLSASSLKYLTLDNTLEDFAQIIRAAKTSPETLFPSANVSTNSTVIFTGGSYGGAIAAWMRAKYPELVTAAWSSSAPVYSYREFYQLDQAFGKHLETRGCSDEFAQAVKDLDAILLSGNQTIIDTMQAKFGIVRMPTQDFAAQLANIASSNVNSPVMLNNDMVDRTICSFFNGYRASLDSYLMALVSIVDGYTPPTQFNSSKTGSGRLQMRQSDESVDISLNQVYRSWHYISCTWFADWQVAAPADSGLTSYRSQLITADTWESDCQTIFDDSIALPVDVASHNDKWFGILQNATQIYYTVGELDPWRGSTVIPEDNKLLPDTLDISMFVIQGATHTQDMQLSNRLDLNSVSEAPLPFHFQFAAGAIAGVSEILCMYPLDVAKTRLMLQVGKGGSDQYKSIIDVFSRIIKEEGPTRLYRGILPPIMVEAPKRAIKFASNDTYGTAYMKLFGAEKLTQPLAILTGVSAGITEAMIVATPELVKIRLQAKENAGRYTGTMDCVRKIYAQEGLRAFANGLEATIWRHALWNGGYFGSIFAIREVMPKASSKKGELANNFIAGAIGGTIGTTLNTPPDVVKTRIQNHNVANGPARYSTFFGGVKTIAQEEGARALYKGYLPKVLRLGPGGGILLVVYDTVTTYMRKNFM
ncbi:hypothetical protein LPJ66_002990 [Kickxella alabastrina]|uniref:Uncharacterized protein n=1 Tax=Kickxella alabastrina TaxID=61397 RepID=A0ACC1IMY0_9FUNG|nr:hypothetical protein LPJ66_002990 [Kickxella alabastrina]